MKSKSKREKILKFFNEATIDEVIHMPRCSEKKASLIISMRPFTDWEDIVSYFAMLFILSLGNSSTVCLSYECNRIRKITFLFLS